MTGNDQCALSRCKYFNPDGGRVARGSLCSRLVRVVRVLAEEILGKSGPDVWAQKKQQERTGDDDADPAPEPVASDAVHYIAQNLCSDYRNRESPSPEAAQEPSDCGRGECGGEQQEQNPNLCAERRELLIGCGIESPDSVESRAAPEQSGGGEARHTCAEDQEDADGREARWLGLDNVRGGSRHA